MDELRNLYNCLMNDNILEHEDEIFKIIPELKYEKNFEQKPDWQQYYNENNWHCQDVWLHTVAAVSACDMNFENRLIMLLHDIGKPFSYQDDEKGRHFKNHANKSAEIANDILDRLNVPNAKKEAMLKLIKMHSTKIEVEDINQNNIAFYRRLLKIQNCDAHGYEHNHSLKALSDLKIIEKELNQKIKESDFER